jgi:hypothetical protein
MADGYGFPIKLKLDAGPRSTVFRRYWVSPETSFVALVVAEKFRVLE